MVSSGMTPLEEEEEAPALELVTTVLDVRELLDQGCNVEHIHKFTVEGKGEFYSILLWRGEE